jgi:hypothetical protein
MASRDRLHIFVVRPAVAEQYTSYGTGRGSPRPPAPIRDVHARKLRDEAEAADREARERRARTAQEVGVRPSGDGMLLTFESFPGFELEPAKFDPGNQPPELIAVRTRREGDAEIQLATVYVPEGSLGFFLKRFEQYGTEDTVKGNRRHADMVERIADLRLATIEALWTDDPAAFPPPEETIWWEVWLRRSDGQEADRLRAFASVAGFDVGTRQLIFDNRAIVLVHASAVQLSSALDIIDDFAELRAAHTNSAFFSQLTQVEQADWVENLAARTTPADDQAPAACILDTGVNRGHPLLEHSIAEDDMYACVPAWGVHDHDGHGTAMAGISLYGDLREALEGDADIQLLHRLESAKILPPTGENDPDLYGAITAEAVARTEVQAPTRRRAFSMAVTADPGGIAGTPTSWSAAVDALAAGRGFDTLNGRLTYIDEASLDAHRLFLLSAGNVSQVDATYLDRCDVEPVQDPAQAWNALTVGAYTDLGDVDAAGADFAGWTVVAPHGDLLEQAQAELQTERHRHDVSLAQLHDQLAQLIARRPARRPAKKTSPKKRATTASQPGAR